METFEAIEKRKSIRKFVDKEIPREILEKILYAGILAPSAKNRQPWKFIVITNKEKSQMLESMKKGIENEKQQQGLLPNYVQFIRSAENTIKIMEQAPLTVFVFNTEKNTFWKNEASIERKFFDIANIQSIGAAIQNMLLTATDLGIGSLWICDIFFAYRELCEYLDEKNQMIAAISFGYQDEQPFPRPRKNLQDIVTWR